MLHFTSWPTNDELILRKVWTVWVCWSCHWWCQRLCSDITAVLCAVLMTFCRRWCEVGGVRISRVSVSVPPSLTPRPRQARLRCLCQLTLWSSSVLTQWPHCHPSTVTHPLHPCLSIRGWVRHLHSVSRPHVVTRCPLTLFFSGFCLHVGPDHISFKRAKITEMRSRS